MFVIFVIYFCYLLLFYETEEPISGKVLLDQKEFLLIKPSPGFAPPPVWITNILIRKRVNGGKGRSGAVKGRLQKGERLQKGKYEKFWTLFHLYGAIFPSKIRKVKNAIMKIHYFFYLIYLTVYILLIKQWCCICNIWQSLSNQVFWNRI